MNIDIHLKILTIHNLPLPSPPHHRRLRITPCQHLPGLPAQPPPPPVLVRAQIESLRAPNPRLVDVAVGWPLVDAVGRVAPEVDVVAVRVLVRGDVAVLGRRVAVPPPALVAEAGGDGRGAVDEFDFGYASAFVPLVVVLVVVNESSKLGQYHRNTYHKVVKRPRRRLRIRLNDTRPPKPKRIRLPPLLAERHQLPLMRHRLIVI